MKRSQGFTLVELIIVIVILGILAVTAAPRFLNLSGDAKGATLDAVVASLQSASALVYGKAIINGVHQTEDGQVREGAGNIATRWGYPAGIKEAIDLILDVESDWDTTTGTAENTPGFGAKAAGTVLIKPQSASWGTTTETACHVVYEQSASSGAKPVITAYKDGC